MNTQNQPGPAAGAENARRRPVDPRHAARIARVRFIASLLDSAVRVPGTRFTVGLDPILGLVPVVGDILPAAGSLYIVFEAWRMGANRATLAKMLLNVGIDVAAGVVPGLGDVFDAAFKANTRNLTLMGLDPVKIEIDPEAWLGGRSARA